ncbi:hypothetical protein L0222_19580 [bacterium]|nr:hypothetical protein [bacterium]MCI0606331.1 hypothetical protein [bacterium]
MKRKNRFAYVHAAFRIAALALLAMSMFISSASAAEVKSQMVIPLVGTGDGAGATGQLQIKGKQLTITVNNAPPNLRFNVFLSVTATANRVPATWIGDFRTDLFGNAKFKLKGMDVTKAFGLFTIGAPTNTATGETSCGATGAGVICGVAQLNALRIYFADPVSATTRSFDRDGVSGALLFTGVVFDVSD